MLSSIDVDFHTTAVYESGRDGEVDSKALNIEYVVTYQYICLQSINQVQLVANGCVDLTAFFVNIRDVNCCKGKVS